MKKYLIYVGLLVARLGGWQEPAVVEPLVDDSLVEIKPYLPFTLALVKAIDVRFHGTSGEFKHAEAIRVLLNQFPQAKQRKLSLAIEVAVAKCST